MHFAIATHSYLVTVELDRFLNLTGYRILDKGHHYGLALVEGVDYQLLSKKK
jgi:hypothetical protein